MKPGLAALPLLIGSCNVASVLPADESATFDPIAFFEGRTRGEGTLHKIVGSDSRVVVHSFGSRQKGGGLVLDQRIQRGTNSPSQRRWVMRPVSPGRFTGALTEAEGPVEGTVSGPRATIRYRTKDGFKIEQHLALQPGGRTLLNQLSVRRFGIRVAHLDETIRKLD